MRARRYAGVAVLFGLTLAAGRGACAAEGSAKTPSGANSSRHELKVRIQSIDDHRGEFKAEVAGRRETFRVESSRDLRHLQEGDLVIVTVERREGNDVVTEIRAAALSGRILRINERGREMTIAAEGHDEVYGVEDQKLFGDLREGDKIRFEFEERPGGKKVITALH